VKSFSNPSLVVLDNQTRPSVGDQVPFLDRNGNLLTGEQHGVSTIDYKNTGSSCGAPRANSNGNIVLDIGRYKVRRGIADADDLAAARQEAIAVTSGQTVLLAGLISRD